MTVYLDFETRSPVDLTKLGACRYAWDASTAVLCMCWAYNHDEEVHLWHRRHEDKGVCWTERSERPDELIERIKGGELVEAHNAKFEYVIWNFVLMREFPELFDVPLQVEQMRCSAAKASCLSLRRKLGDAANDIGLTERKDVDGSRLINKLSKPMKPRKKKGVVPSTELTWCEEEIEHRRNWNYCAQDVRTERALSDFCPEMTERELEYWRMDFRMNMRGIKLDKAAAEDAIELCRREVVRLDGEMQDLTGGRVLGGSKRIAFRAWANEQVAELNKTTQPSKSRALVDSAMEPLADTRADTLSFALHGVPTKAAEEAKVARKPEMDKLWQSRGTIGATLKKAMEICLEVNRSSVAKFKTMRDSVCPDGRLHDIMLYNGADRTGRWSGQGVQPHNFVRGYMKEMGEYTLADKDDPERGEKPSVWETLLTRDELGDLDLDFITLIEGAPLPALAKACRGALIASDGKELYAADFKAIEARKLAWMANCTSQLDLFRNKGDPYLAMASAIYGREITKADKMERQLGKKCFAADTRVLTDRGIMPIVEVLASDRLWDGKEWVTHDGLVDRGVREVCLFGGTWATPEHPVSGGGNWYHWESLAQDENISLRALAYASGNLPSGGTHTESVAGLSARSPHVHAALRFIWSIFQTCVPDVRLDVINALKKLRGIGESIFGGMLTSCPTTLIGFGSLTGFQLALDDVQVLATRHGSTTESGGSKSGPLGLRIDENFSGIWSRYRGGTTPFSNLIVKTMTEAINQGICISQLKNKIWQTVQRLQTCADGSRILKRVYDIANAGPRRRFTIITDVGPLIVHNSVLGLGYNMGWEKFQLTVWNEEGIWLDDAFCKKVVQIYRKKQCPEMPVLWKAIERAAIAAVQEGDEHVAIPGPGQVSYFVNGRFLHCRLPSGRLLAYLDPEVHERINYRYMAKNERGTPCLVTFQSKIGVPMSRVKRHAEQIAERQRKTLNGEQPETFLSPHLSFMGRHIVTKEWKRLGTHGGSLTENADQASSRDLLAEAMYRVDQDERFDLLLSIHDEVIAEAPIGTMKVSEFESIMSEVPIWAPGMPIEAEGWIGPRLRK